MVALAHHRSASLKLWSAFVAALWHAAGLLAAAAAHLQLPERHQAAPPKAVEGAPGQRVRARAGMVAFTICRHGWLLPLAVAFHQTAASPGWPEKSCLPAPLPALCRSTGTRSPSCTTPMPSPGSGTTRVRALAALSWLAPPSSRQGWKALCANDASADGNRRGQGHAAPAGAPATLAGIMGPLSPFTSPLAEHEQHRELVELWWRVYDCASVAAELAARPSLAMC